MDASKYTLAKLYALKSLLFRQMNYDDQFYEAIRMYHIFLQSGFNNLEKSEYQCLHDFVNSKDFKRNKITAKQL